ncbi:MAG: hypothetical protein ABL999_08480 [Pyrinomonadaceae bacterium]
MLFLSMVVGILVSLVVWNGFWRLVTLIVGQSSRQKAFLAGVVPTSQPDGFYNGSAYLLGSGPVPWLGKSFETANERGFNTFTPAGATLLKLLTPFYKLFRVNSDGNTDAYYFKTSVSAGFKDTSISTFKLDYDSPENPFLIRIILDEIVETSPDEFLGKVHLKVFPRYYATIGFFGLKKAN